MSKLKKKRMKIDAGGEVITAEAYIDKINEENKQKKIEDDKKQQKEERERKRIERENKKLTNKGKCNKKKQNKPVNTLRFGGGARSILPGNV